MRWLIREWPYAAIFTAAFLVVLLPFFGTLGLPLVLIYLQLPLYMIHQFEEHDQDRFRKFVNQTIAGGREAFTPLSIFVINSLGVWVIDLLVLYLAFYVDLSFGLVAIYLPLLNSIGHVAFTIALRRYNPGLWTSLFLFLPLGSWALYVVSKASHAGWQAQAASIGAAVLLHAVIFAYIKLRLRKLAR
jgi:Protein of unknown function with HXXEE motif